MGGEPSGEFSVRSAYKLLESNVANPRAYTLQNIYKKFYKKLWLLNIPGKIKITIWRLSWNFLPTQVNLMHKKVTNNASYPRYGEKTETTDHVFRECPVTVEMWSELTFQHMLRNQNMDLEQWLTWVIEQLNPWQCSIFCCTIWAIWGARNKRIHENRISTSKEITGFVNKYITEITDDIEKNSVRLTKNIGWRFPPETFVKINFDGAYNGRQNLAASGIVVKDEEGRVLLSHSKIHQEIPSVFAAEVVACWEAVKVGVEKKWRHIIIEGDSLAIIKKCKSNSQDRLLIGAFIHDIKHKIETLKKNEEVYLEMAVPEYAEEQ
ncbi:hypothetical protein J1N35_014506 [Gossypium stocksii]|uniref:RNase H type-1 domain-containing protein n=1 Tax=Gossypium stocksii TaxID=47602 RepID=A0A9D3VU78_9ROSI|nr:hypothetical protein J1N35_014506 [Gossypium stocksii]